MASKRKKILTGGAKQSEAHYKNLFCQKVYEVAKAVCSDDAYKCLTPKILEHIYERRIRTIKFVADDDLDFSSKDLQYFKEILVHHLRTEKIVFKAIDYTTNLYDLLGPCLSLWSYLRNIVDENFHHFEKINKGFKGFTDSADIFNDSFKVVNADADFIAWELTSIDKRIIGINMSFQKEESNTFIYIEIRISGRKPEVINATFDGNTRPAFRIGLSFNGSFGWFDSNAKMLDLPYFSPETPIPVYIQHHALKRLTERLDCVRNMVILLALIDSVSDAKCIHYNGKKLIEFKYFAKKIGYLVVELYHGAAVIRTFLLLTHASTPESEKLQQIVGLEKMDITYLNLDKLSTFVQSNIRQNTLLRDLFTRAGCKALLEVEKNDFDKECVTPNAAFIESFIYKYKEFSQGIDLSEIELLPAG